MLAGEGSVCLATGISQGGSFQMRHLLKDTRSSGLVPAVFMAILGIFTGAWLGIAPAQAQNGTGVIEGIVEDTNGGKLPNAMIKAFNNSTGQNHQATSDSEGAFRLPNLTFGKYRVEISLGGFAKKLVSDVNVEPVNVAKLTIVLSPQGV